MIVRIGIIQNLSLPESDRRRILAYSECMRPILRLSLMPISQYVGTFRLPITYSVTPCTGPEFEV